MALSDDIAAFLRGRESQIAAFAVLLRRFFRAQSQRVQEAITSPETAILEVSNAMEIFGDSGILSRLVSPRVLEAFNRGWNRSGDAFEYEVEFRDTTSQDPVTADVIAQILSQTSDLNQGTLDDLIATLTEGVQAGEDLPKLRSRVRATFSEYQASIDNNRVERIARTIQTSAWNAGHFEAMKSAGILFHTWRTVNDEDVRSSHEALNKETVAIGLPFANGLLYPGDPNGPISEWINCRCVTTPALTVDG